jgi:hypothetical protein
MNKKLLHLALIAVVVIGPPAVMAYFTLRSACPGCVGFAGLLFPMLGGFVMALGAQYQTDLQYYTPLLAWKGTPRQIIKRRFLWGITGALWMLIPVAFFFLIPIGGRAFVRWTWDLWWLWSIGLPLVALTAALIADAAMHRQALTVSEDALPSSSEAQPNRAKMRYLAGYLVFMLALQALIQFGGRRVGINTVLMIGCFVMGIISLLSAVFYRKFEHWFSVHDEPPPESLVQRQRWLMIAGTVVFPAVGVAMLTGLIPPEQRYLGFLVPGGLFLLFMLVDHWSWRIRVFREKWKASKQA